MFFKCVTVLCLLGLASISSAQEDFAGSVVNLPNNESQEIPNGLLRGLTASHVDKKGKRPKALCQDVQRRTDQKCSRVHVDPDRVDGGSYDPDGPDRKLDFRLKPAGPYRKGTTSVTLTAIDRQGRKDSCKADIHIVDRIAPSQDDGTRGKIGIYPPDARKYFCAAVSTMITATDNCDPDVLINAKGCTSNQSRNKGKRWADGCKYDRQKDEICFLAREGAKYRVKFLLKDDDRNTDWAYRTVQVYRKKCPEDMMCHKPRGSPTVPIDRSQCSKDMASHELKTRPSQCRTFNWPKRLNENVSPKRTRREQLIWAEPENEGVENAAQFCYEEGYDGVGSYTINFPCEDNDESSFVDWNGRKWVGKDTPSKNKCYKMFRSIKCCNGCTTFSYPQRLDDLIWAEPESAGIANAAQFCKEMGFAGAGKTVVDFPCEDNDELSFANWNGNKWVYKDTPSKNRCYKMWKSIECCPLCAKFQPPRRLDDLIWAEPSREGDANINQFCHEQGFEFVASSSIDFPCEDNDESSFTTWNGSEWVKRDSPSANRCYKMWKNLKCCCPRHE